MARYYLIDRKLINDTGCYLSPESLTTLLLGQQISRYIIVKSDEKGDRVVVISGDIIEANKILLAA